MKSLAFLVSLCLTIGIAPAQDTSAPAKKVLASHNGVAKTIRVMKTAGGFERLMAIGALKDAILKKRPFSTAEHDAIVTALFQTASTRKEIEGLDVSNPAVEALVYLKAVKAIKTLGQSKFIHDQWVAIHGMNESVGFYWDADCAKNYVNVAKQISRSKDPDLADEAKKFLRSVARTPR